MALVVASWRCGAGKESRRQVMRSSARSVLPLVGLLLLKHLAVVCDLDLPQHAAALSTWTSRRRLQQQLHGLQWLQRRRRGLRLLRLNSNSNSDHATPDRRRQIRVRTP